MREVANQQQGLYRPEFEHDNCGIGSVVNIKGIKTHETVENALKIVENLKHRAGKDAEGKTGDFALALLSLNVFSLFPVQHFFIPVQQKKL